jgi:hypothetical protein
MVCDYGYKNIRKELTTQTATLSTKELRSQTIPYQYFKDEALK